MMTRPVRSPIEVWKAWRKLLREDYRRCPEGDEYTEALQVANDFVREFVAYYELPADSASGESTEPSLTVDACLWCNENVLACHCHGGPYTKARVEEQHASARRPVTFQVDDDAASEPTGSTLTTVPLVPDQHCPSCASHNIVLTGRCGDCAEVFHVEAGFETDFYEEDEPVEKVKAAFEQSPKFVTGPSPNQTASAKSWLTDALDNGPAIEAAYAAGWKECEEHLFDQATAAVWSLMLESDRKKYVIKDAHDFVRERIGLRPSWDSAEAAPESQR